MNTLMVPDLTGVILAGGRGSRMENRDKGLVELSGKPLIEYLLNRLRPQVGQVVISANRNLEQYRAFGHPVLSDVIEDYPGPLGGILTALENCETDYLITAPCDAPLLLTDYARRMWDCMVETDKAAAVAHDGERLQPMYSLLPRTAQESLVDFLASGASRTRDWITSLSPAGVDFSDTPEHFINANTELELVQLQSHLESTK